MTDNHDLFNATPIGHHKPARNLQPAIATFKSAAIARGFFIS